MDRGGVIEKAPVQTESQCTEPALHMEYAHKPVHRGGSGGFT